MRIKRGAAAGCLPRRRMLKTVKAELAQLSGKFMSVARNRCRRRTRAGAGGRAAGADMGSGARPLSGVRGMHRTALYRWTRERTGTRLDRVSVRSPRRGPLSCVSRR
ncbi:hypothetical protein GCM10023084_36470 [Streptomyces lacrimifluminis]|uniref:Uncharacterized protein n=1 Tax=Streptomyces lacrimifluminis TaxID=1500077 RepID=A0A917NX81_9ACTN|nr:hypothetical protein GCM10012282_37480 [Streptomyces lacrimifluminis]